MWGKWTQLRTIWTASSEFGTYSLCEHRRFRRACASAQSRQNLRCSLIQAVSQEEPSDRKPDPWPLWMAGHAQLKFVMTECSKTQIRLTGLIRFTGMLFKIKANVFQIVDRMNKTKGKLIFWSTVVEYTQKQYFLNASKLKWRSEAK